MIVGDGRTECEVDRRRKSARSSQKARNLHRGSAATAGSPIVSSGLAGCLVRVVDAGEALPLPGRAAARAFCRANWVAPISTFLDGVFRYTRERQLPFPCDCGTWSGPSVRAD